MSTSNGTIFSIALTLAGCTDVGSSAENVAQAPGLTRAQHIQALFDSLLDGVQLIEANDEVVKVSTAVDGSTSPPRYEVGYEGCVEGFVSGSLCVEQGRHLVEIQSPEVHIIRAVEQSYVLDGFGSLPDYQMTGDLFSIVDVRVDTGRQTTQVEGLASGVLVVAGGIEGVVEVELELGGGRNYTESAATPILVEGTFIYDGEPFGVEGGFQRE